MGSEFSAGIKEEDNQSTTDSLSDFGIARNEYDDTSSFNCFSVGSSSHSRGMVGGLFGEIIGSDNFKSPPTFKIASPHTNTDDDDSNSNNINIITEWNSSQYETERHFYSDDFEVENGYIKSIKPRSPTSHSRFTASFDSSCSQLTPQKELEERTDGEDYHFENNTETPSDDEITKIMYQQYVLQYHLTLYKFPSECDEFYDYYFEHINRPYKELEEEFEWKFQQFALSRYTFPNNQNNRRRSKLNLLDECNEFLEYCTQNR